MSFKKSVLSSLLLALASSTVQAVGNNPITNCATALGVQGDPSPAANACNLSPNSGLAAASVNVNNYMNGAQCGRCYLVTGPSGSTTVQIVNSCSGVADCERLNTTFVLDSTAYGAVADRNVDRKINDLSYREVTCPTTGNIQATVKGQSGNTYFAFVLSNSLTTVTGVQIKGSGWASADTLNRVGTTYQWSWNKAAYTLQFPVTLYITGRTGDVITAKVNSQWSTGSPVDLGVQFRDTVAVSNPTCVVSAPPNALFDEQLASGWDLASNHDNSTNLQATVGCDTGSKYCITVQMTNSQYDLQFKRDGNVYTKYFQAITFDAKADQPSQIGVFFDDKFSARVFFNLSTSFSVFTYNFTEIPVPDYFNVIHFYNPDSNKFAYTFDNIYFVNADVSPAANVSRVSSTTQGLQFITTGSQAQTSGSATTGGSQNTGNTGSQNTGSQNTGNSNSGSGSTGTNGGDTSSASYFFVSSSLVALTSLLVYFF